MCDCQKTARPAARTAGIDGLPAGHPAAMLAEAVRRGYVVVTDARGERHLVDPAVAADLVRRDPGARVVKSRATLQADGTLGDAGRPDEVYLSGVFGNIVRGIRTGIGAIAAPAGAIAGGIVGGPAGAAAGWSVGGAVGGAVRPPSADARLQRRARDLAQQAARLGVQIDEPTALWLAGQTDAQVRTWLAEAKRRQDAAMQQQFATQVSQAGATNYAPNPSAYLTPAQQQQLAAQQAAQPPGTGASVSVSAGGSLLSSPLLLGGAALALVLVLKK